MNTVKSTMYIIAGPNGSGKTTLARELITDENIIFLNADEIAVAINDKIGIQSGKIILNQLNDILKSGQSFVLESTISGRHHLQAIRQAQQNGYNIILIYVFLESVEQNLARIKMRTQLGGHNVPKTDVVRRYKRSLKNFWDLTHIITNWKLYYNGGTRFQLVARHDSKDLEIIDLGLYNKMCKVTK